MSLSSFDSWSFSPLSLSSFWHKEEKETIDTALPLLFHREYTESHNQVTMHIHISASHTELFLLSLRWVKKGRSVTCEHDYREWVTVHLTQVGEKDPAAPCCLLPWLPTTEQGGCANLPSTSLPTCGHLWEAKAGTQEELRRTPSFPWAQTSAIPKTILQTQ